MSLMIIINVFYVLAIVSTGTRLISLDLDKVQSNMVFMNFNTPLLTASDFCHRLYKVIIAHDYDYCNKTINIPILNVQVIQ